MAIKGQNQGSFGDGVMRYFDCVHVNILVMIFDFGFVRHCHWRKLSKGYIGLLCITSYRYTCIYIYLKTKNAIKKSQHELVSHSSTASLQNVYVHFYQISCQRKLLL